MMERAKALGCDWVFTSDGTVPIVPDTLAVSARELANRTQRRALPSAHGPDVCSFQA